MSEARESEVRNVVTLTLVVELPQMPTQAQYDEGGGVQFLDMIDSGEAEVLFAAAEPGTTPYASMLGADGAWGGPSKWAPEAP